MTARMRRIASDWEQIRKDFTGHPQIVVTPAGGDPPEAYRITYFVSGIYKLPDGKIQPLGRHEVEITLHADYPRYKPVCRIFTPIWHPNFRDGQICIGDIWGAGESLSDIIINIGDMIQYKSWNSYSPLCAEAAQWAILNKHMFPIGSAELRKADYENAHLQVDIDLFDDAVQGDAAPSPAEPPAAAVQPMEPAPVMQMAAVAPAAPQWQGAQTPWPAAQTNDFDITAADLADIEFHPTAERIQSSAQGGVVPGRRINLKTILVKGIVWAFIGAVVSFALSECLLRPMDNSAILRWIGQYEVADFCDYINHSETFDEDTFTDLYDKIPLSDDEVLALIGGTTMLSTGFYTAWIALGLGLFLGIGEGVYYGSKRKTLNYALMGAGLSIGLGFVSGLLAQLIYTNMVSDSESILVNALVRGFGWSIMGLGVGMAAGLIKPEKRRILFCALGGFAGAFAGGILFELIAYMAQADVANAGVFARAVAIVTMGLLIGLGIGLLEQVAKSAWLKVVRGEFEGKEYLVFSGTTSIGNNGHNTIVLFKDKLVGPHHCDIVLEGGRYMLVDAGTPLGTMINGRKIQRQALRRGDSIVVGNSVLVFSTK